ncbi:MAG: sensor histidine kinase [Myxococcota bacterium]
MPTDPSADPPTRPPVRLHLVGNVAAPQRSGGIELASAGGADVWAVDGTPTSAPPHRVAVLRVAAPSETPAGPPADHCVSSEAFAEDAASAARAALDRRLARRPDPRDDVRDWLAALLRLTGADGVAFRTAARSVEVGELSLGGRVPPGARTVAGASAAEIADGADGIVSTPAWWGDDSGQLLLGVRRDGTAWVLRNEGEIGAAAASATAASRARRLGGVEEQLALVRSALGVVVHDIRGALFGLDLGTRLLQRIDGAQTVARSLTGGVSNPPQRSPAPPSPRCASCSTRRPTPGPRPRWRRPGRPRWRPPPVRTPSGAASACLGPRPRPSSSCPRPSLSRILGALLHNALAHGTADAPVTAAWQRGEGEVALELRNGGELPFERLDALKPFVHRAHGGAGLGLWLARAATERHGGRLDVSVEGSDVVARLTLPAD